MKASISLLILFLSFVHSSAVAQLDFLKAPQFKKVEKNERDAFEKRFTNARWTGQGTTASDAVDMLPSMEVRARLQTLFGGPTLQLEDLIEKPNFRPAQFIQFEYWFTVNDSIPMMILDVDGPFENGLVFAGASRYVDLMPEIKREFSRLLMSVDKMGEYTDLFYSPEDSRIGWYEVSYKNGEFKSNKVPRPAKYKNLNLDVK